MLNTYLLARECFWTVYDCHMLVTIYGVNVLLKYFLLNRIVWVLGLLLLRVYSCDEEAVFLFLVVWIFRIWMFLFCVCLVAYVWLILPDVLISLLKGFKIVNVHFIIWLLIDICKNVFVNLGRVQILGICIKLASRLNVHFYNIIFKLILNIIYLKIQI